MQDSICLLGFMNIINKEYENHQLSLHYEDDIDTDIGVSDNQYLFACLPKYLQCVVLSFLGGARASFLAVVCGDLCLIMVSAFPGQMLSTLRY